MSILVETPAFKEKFGARGPELLSKGLELIPNFAVRCHLPCVGWSCIVNAWQTPIQTWTLAMRSSRTLVSEPLLNYSVPCAHVTHACRARGPRRRDQVQGGGEDCKQRCRGGNQGLRRRCECGAPSHGSSHLYASANAGGTQVALCKLGDDFITEAVAGIYR